MGGTVVITGTNTYSSQHGINNVDLVYDMESVKYRDGDAEITLTGQVIYKDYWNDNAWDITCQSQNLYMKGSVIKSVKREIDTLGVVIVNNKTNSLSVDILGYTNTWSYE